VLLVCTVYSGLYSEIALSRKPFGIGHVYIYTFLLRMADTMTSCGIKRPTSTHTISVHSFPDPTVAQWMHATGADVSGGIHGNL
jgi:hypothetical protein